MPGGRARIGLLIPANNAAIEYDMWKMAVEGVTFHSTRLPPTKGCEPHDPEEFRKELSTAYSLIREVSDAVVYGRSYGSHTHSSIIREVIDKTLVIPEEAAVNALRSVQAKRIWLATPYTEDRAKEEVSYLSSAGFTVVGQANLNKRWGVDISNTPVFTIYRLVKREFQRVRQADAVYIACTALSTFEAVAYLSEDLHMPVISENVASALALEELLGLRLNIPGRQALR
ncbi:MAG: maleate cis-trans isomerase family protein [Thermoprotei archaeon]